MRSELSLPHGRTIWRHLVVAALLANAIPYALFGFAEQHVDSKLAGAINATTPLCTVLFALATRAEVRLTPKRWVGMLLGFAGALLILARGNTTALPSAERSPASSRLLATEPARTGLAYVLNYRIIHTTDPS